MASIFYVCSKKISNLATWDKLMVDASFVKVSQKGVKGRRINTRPRVQYRTEF